MKTPTTNRKLASLIRAADKAKFVKSPKGTRTTWLNEDGSVFMWPTVGKKYAIIEKEMVPYVAKRMLRHAKKNGQAASRPLMMEKPTVPIL